MTDSHRSTVLRASEIGNYVYCARSWWLSRVMGYPSANKESMTLGEEAHRHHGRAVVAHHRLERVGHVLVSLGLLLGLLAVAWWFAGVLAG